MWRGEGGADWRGLQVNWMFGLLISYWILRAHNPAVYLRKNTERYAWNANVSQLGTKTYLHIYVHIATIVI